MSGIASYLMNRDRATPDATAMVDRTLARHANSRPLSLAAHGYSADTLSFASFARRICALAGGLRATCGLSPGERVVLYVENRPEMFDLLFACWTAGLCVVPVNAKLHAREVEC